VDELRHDEVRDLVVDRAADEDDPLVQQARVNVEGALAPRGLLDHHRDQRAVGASDLHVRVSSRVSCNRLVADNSNRLVAHRRLTWITWSSAS
jgi:hypothetical protein